MFRWWRPVSDDAVVNHDQPPDTAELLRRLSAICDFRSPFTGVVVIVVIVPVSVSPGNAAVSVSDVDDRRLQWLRDVAFHRRRLPTATGLFRRLPLGNAVTPRLILHRGVLQRRRWQVRTPADCDRVFVVQESCCRRDSRQRAEVRPRPATDRRRKLALLSLSFISFVVGELYTSSWGVNSLIPLNFPTTPSASSPDNRPNDSSQGLLNVF